MNKKSKYTNPSKSSSREWIWISLVLIVVAAVVFGGIYMLNQKKKNWEGYYEKDFAFPTRVSVTKDGVLEARGESVRDNATEITIFEDALCPACSDFERRLSHDLYQGVDDGKIVLKVQLMDFLNELSVSKTYSTRALAAIQCVAQGEDSAQTLRFKSALLENQPAENGPTDYSNEQLASFAKEWAHVSEKTQNCIAQGTKVEEAKKIGEKSATYLQEIKGTGTPTILIDGKQVELGDAAKLIEKIAKG